jgi:hypothetical protein
MTNEKEYGQMNFNLPHDVVPLPSQGLFYKNKKKSIKVGYLTAQDENLLMSNNLQGADLMTQLIRTKIYEPDLKIDDMLVGDVEAVLIFLRNTAFGTKYEITSIDPQTGKRFESSLDLSELNIKQVEQKPDESGFFTVKLPTSNDVVQLKILTFGEDAALDKEINQYPNAMTKPVVTRKLEQQIISINGSTDRGDISTYIMTMPISDSKFIRKFLRDVEPRLDLTKKIQTPSGELIDVNINFGVEFFRPFFAIQ